MRKLLTLLTVIALLTSCKSENKKDETAPDKTLTEKIADEAGKIISEGVYEIKKGEKGGKVFIIEGTKLYAVGKNNSKDLFLEKRGNKVYDFSNGQDGSSAVFIFEGNKYWEIDKKTGEKANLIFERKGNYIYQNGKNGMEKMFIVD
ncbi:hypothetical protein [Maribacter sp. R86514]|uniref:hypothetical protein n=1 Tax=Maribacter sp. R86514 TaxID=3093854 RepID=UPI0037C7F810